jgi:acetyl-CoA C-acetyltransferase
LCAQQYGITREQQDAFSIGSYERAAAAWASGAMGREVVPVTLPPGRNKTAVTVTTDEEFTGIKLDKVATLKPAFGKDGTVTAANASKLSDGASALVLCSGREARARGMSPLFRVLGFGDVCKDPVEFTTAPADAIPMAIEHANRTTLKGRAEGPLTLKDVQFHEINEAFSVVALVNAQILGIDIATVNVHGGAVALGHPLGSSGSRIIGALYNVLFEKKAKYGCASICNGGGGASAVLIERLD